MTRLARTLALAVAVAVAGCANGTELRDADLRAGAAVLDPVRRAGFDVRLEAARDAPALRARVRALQEAKEPRPAVLVLAPGTAALVSNLTLDGALDRSARDAILAEWVTPFLDAAMPQPAPKAFAYGLTKRLAERGLVDRRAPVVPFLPPARPRFDRPSETRDTGPLVALGVFAAGASLLLPRRRR